MGYKRIEIILRYVVTILLLLLCSAIIYINCVFSLVMRYIEYAVYIYIFYRIRPVVALWSKSMRARGRYTL